MRTWTRLVTTFMCAGGVSLAAGCGDDGGGGGDDDPDPIDAMVDMEPEIDAPPTADRAMSVAVVEVALTSPQGVAAGIKGGLISIEFSDLTTGGGETVFGTSPIGGCVVTRHDAQNPPHPLVDAGTITVATGEDSAEELGMTVGPCSYQTGQGYLCISHAGAGVAATGATVANGVVTYTMPSQDFGDGLRGSYLNIDGFTANPTFNASTGPFPIVGQGGPTILQVINQAGMGAAETADVTFSVINGAGPIPTSSPFEFLDGPSSTVRISKGDDDNWAAFDYTLYHRGSGLVLDAESAQPHEFPAKADGSWVFSCDGKGGDCGEDSTQADTLEALIISGRTTDVTIPQGVPDYWMPPASMATTYATFQCAFVAPDDASATVPESAIQAILGTNPTRIETRVLRVVGVLPQDGLNAGRILVGHGLVGHTTL